MFHYYEFMLYLISRPCKKIFNRKMYPIFFPMIPFDSISCTFDSTSCTIREQNTCEIYTWIQRDIHGEVCKYYFCSKSNKKAMIREEKRAVKTKSWCKNKWLTKQNKIRENYIVNQIWQKSIPAVTVYVKE